MTHYHTGYLDYQFGITDAIRTEIKGCSPKIGLLRQNDESPMSPLQ